MTMSIVNAKLLAENIKRFNSLHKVGLSNDTIASAARDKTGDASITAQDVAGFSKLANLGSTRMLVSAKQAKKLTQFAKDADAAAAKAVGEARKTSKHSRTADTDA
jgi:hypothetical protein